MPNEVLQKTGAQQISFADHATDFVGGATKTAIEVSGQLDVQIDLTGLGVGAGRESAKFDFGATRAREYSILATLEFATAPVTGELFNFYLAPTSNSVAANGNIMSIDGVDAAAPSGFSTLKELIDACRWIGAFVCSADATPTVQNAFCGVFPRPNATESLSPSTTPPTLSTAMRSSSTSSLTRSSTKSNNAPQLRFRDGG